MDLEPRSATEDNDVEDAALRDVKRKFWISAVLSVPVFLLSMGTMVSGLGVEDWMPSKVRQWLEMVLTTPVVVWAGAAFFRRGWQSIAAGLLYPFFGLMLNPMIAGAAMSFSSVSVIANALRLKRSA